MNVGVAASMASSLLLHGAKSDHEPMVVGQASRPVHSEPSSELVTTGLLNSSQDLWLDYQKDSVEHLEWGECRTRQANVVRAHVIMTSRLVQG
jgi:hypothetical protein